MSRSLRNLIASITALLLGGVLLHLVGDSAREQRQRWPAEESYVTLPPPEAARWVYLGYNELAADITWSRLLVYYGQGFLGDSDLRYLGRFVDNIIALDPRFKKVYQWSVYSVTVGVEQQPGIRHSIKILHRAMEEYPEDYEFFWLAGVRYYLNLKSDDEAERRRYKEKGAEYLEAAMEKPNAPKDLATQAASFRYRLGQVEQARTNLMQMIMTTDDEKARAKMLRSFGRISDEGVAEELAQAAEQFAEIHHEHMPQVGPNLFVLLGGPPPSPVIDFDALATERDLFGSQESQGIQLFE